MKPIFVILLSSVTLLSCVNHIDDTTFDGIILEAPLLHEIEEDSLLSFSSLFESVDTIYLNNDSVESTVGSIDNVKFSEGLVFIQSNNELFVFNEDGSFKNKIGKKGRGPGEYLNLSKFDVLSSKKEVSILDCNLNRVLVYSYDGVFLRKFDFKDFIHDFAVLPNGNYLFMNPDFYGRDTRRGLWELDSLGNFVNQYFTISDDYLHVSINTHYLVHISPEIIGCQGIEDFDYIYHYKNGTLNPEYKFKTDIVVPNKIKKKGGRWSNPNKEYTKTGYYESERLLILTATNFETGVKIVYDKKSKTLFRLYSDYLQRIKSADNYLPYFCACYEGKYVMYLDAASVLNSDILKEKFPTITSDSNPILLIANERID